MAYASEIELKLDELISTESGGAFQSLATILVQQKCPQLVACERKWDGGLDAYAKGVLEPDGRGIGLACSLTGSLAKIQEDVANVRLHYPDVRTLIFATPKKVSNHTAEQWAKAILDEFGLQLIVIPRANLVIRLQDPKNSDICGDQLGIAPSMAPELEPALKRAQEAAKEVADNWDRTFRKAGRPVISLNAVKLNADGYPIETLTTASLNTVLVEAQRIILEAPAGSGKTTTLVQLAQHVLAAGGLALLVDLSGWVRSNKSVLQYVAEKPQFASQDVNADLLSKLRSERPFVFLLNGWNEVSVGAAEAADSALRDLDRDFPAAIIVVATRMHRLIPRLRGAFRLALNPLERPQRNEYLQLALKESAHGLRVQLDNSRVLDSITRTPLFLAEVADLYRSGNDIPATKMGVLGAVMDAVEQSPEHQTSLSEAPLRGNAGGYLRALAMKMTERGETKIAEEDARAAVNSESETLRAAAQIVSAPDPGEILNELSKRHVLVRSHQDEVLFGFLHQQFQEFFAAAGLKLRLVNLIRGADPKEDRKFLASYVNEPRWGESLRMLAEEIGSSDGQKSMVELGTKLVRMALEVDPIFAGELARWCGPAVWSEVRNEMGVRLRAWYAVPDHNHKQCALAAMLATGSDDFRDIVVPLLTDPNQQIRLAVYHSGAEFLPSSLGPHWSEVVQGWSEEARLDLILQLAHDPWLSGTVEQLALADPSPKIKWNAARQLSWYGFTDKVEKLLTPLGDSDFRMALGSLHSEEIPPSLLPRAIEAYEAMYVEAGGTFEHLRILRLLQILGAKEIAKRIKAELEALDEKQLKSGNEVATKWALEELRKSDPQWVSDWLAQKVLDGSTRIGGWTEMVTGLPVEERERLLARFSSELLEPNKQYRLLPILAATADGEVAVRVFDRACEIRRELANAPGQDMPKWNLFRQQEDLLKAIAPEDSPRCTVAQAGERARDDRVGCTDGCARNV